MKILFVHPNFPSQFRDVAKALAACGHDVLFLTKKREGSIPGVRKAVYEPSRAARASTHHYLRGLENSVLEGQAAYRTMRQLDRAGWRPDVVFGHAGFGGSLFAKDAFPEAAYLANFEWFYHSEGSDSDFDPAEPLTEDDRARIRMKNTALLVDLVSSDAGICPTDWQRTQFPPQFRDKLFLLHEGIDTDYFAPEREPCVLPTAGLDLTGVDEIVTYATRGMEPYRGFPQFIEAAYLLQQQRPHVHIVIAGADRVAYGRPLPDGRTYKSDMLEKFPLDPKRTHFTGLLPYKEYRTLLRSSKAHVYLTRPFVLSWSLMEAMSCGCLVVGSSTPPVQEVMEDGLSGLLVEFFCPDQLAARIEWALDHQPECQSIREEARRAIVENYALRDLLPRRMEWVLAKGRSSGHLEPSSACGEYAV